MCHTPSFLAYKILKTFTALTKLVVKQLFECAVSFSSRFYREVEFRTQKATLKTL